MGTRDEAVALLERVRRFMEAQELPGPGEPVLVGLSGGADSVVLTEVLRRLGYPVQAAHVNYQLRGTASAADEAFVRAFCDERAIRCHVERVETKAEVRQRGLSLQETARELRYAFFEDVARRMEIGWVAVGHHQDDQAETLLLHLLRGTGIEGLAGMPVQRTLSEESPIQLMRPLLERRRREIEAFAEAQGLVWRIDATNEDPAYRRGVIRTKVLPLLEAAVEPAAVPNIARAAALVRAYVDGAFADTLRRAFAAAAETGPEPARRLRLDELAALPGVWRRRVLLEALRQWLPDAGASERRALDLEALLDAQVGRRLELPGGQVWRERDHLTFVAEGAQPEAGAPVQVHQPGITQMQDGVLQIDVLDEKPAVLDPGSADVIYVDRAQLVEPLMVRPWQAGDRFEPFGLGHRKLVSDLLTDARIPPHRRKHIRVLTAGGAVLWVIGVRMDERGRVTDRTQQVAKITYKWCE